MKDSTPIIPDDALCIACGYSLRNLDAARCPECGRAFDPLDSKTMNLGRKPGWMLRYLLRPKRRWPMLALVLATCLMLLATRWPRGAVILQAIDLPYYFDSIHLRSKLISETDWAYVLGLALAATVFIAWIISLPLRAMLRKIYRQPPPPPVNLGRRVVLATFAIAAIGGSIIIGWPYRIARAWIRQIMAMPAAPQVRWVQLPDSPIALTPRQYEIVLRAAAMQLPSSVERITALKLLMEKHPQEALPILLDAVARERDPQVRATQVRLIGLYQDISTLQPLLSWWDDPDLDVRIAVTDAIGLLHRPGYPIFFPSNAEGPWIGTAPRITLYFTDAGTDERKLPGPHPDQQFPGGVGNRMDYIRPQVEQRMLSAANSAEREAAARALVAWQPKYKLRVAEWGVWICEGGKMKLSEAIIEEIPPFVHRIGDPLSSLEPRFEMILVPVAKPILHFTTDRVMAVDVQVIIKDGRPWFAFPLPDDYAIAGQRVFCDIDPTTHRLVAPRPVLEALDPVGMPPLKDPREGYPSLEPSHTTIALKNTQLATQNQITSLGVRWQSVIVSPNQLAWMQPPQIPPDPKYAWWDRLRQVPCAWVSNRGETDRFLYYDGPTTAKPPGVASCNGKVLRVEKFVAEPERRQLDSWERDRSFTPISSVAKTGYVPQGIYIKVDTATHVLSGFVIDHPGVFYLQLERVLEGDALIRRFHQLLTEAGLTDAEASGLVDCWRAQFFQTPGARFILLMSAMDYDLLCPIRIDPPPTELVRVGLVLSEFGM